MNSLRRFIRTVLRPMPKHRHHGHALARTAKHGSHISRGVGGSPRTGITNQVEKGAAAYDKSFKKKS
ncbi:MAG: hypothetical protein GXP35_03255 [Actinobacteria bacterium]|nr:hypothetical protein [Actinomycetota bacterium]